MFARRVSNIILYDIVFYRCRDGMQRGFYQGADPDRLDAVQYLSRHAWRAPHTALPPHLLWDMPGQAVEPEQREATLQVLFWQYKLII
jgi:hypothetical protein